MTEPAHRTEALRVAGLNKSFGSTHAVRDVTFALRHGSIHALLGENGAGKSTVIAMLSGFTQPDSGDIWFGADRAPARLRSPNDALHRGVTTVFQQSSLIADLTVQQNLQLHAQVDLVAAQELIAELSPLPPSLDARVTDLDLGSRTVVELARAIATNPSVLILDEPTALVSTETTNRLLRVMRRLASEGVAVCMVTHKLAEVLEVADEVTVLGSGAVAAEIAGDELRRHETADAQQRLVDAMFGVSDAERVIEPLAPEHPIIAEPRDKPVLEITNPPRLRCSVAAGEILGVAGISGNGQQELAELIDGTASDTSVRVLLDGVDVSRASVRARQRLGIASLTDDRFGEGLVAAMSLAANLALKKIGDQPFWRAGFTQSRTLETDAEATIAERNIRASSPDAPASSLSGGNAQKLLLARDAKQDARVTVFRQPTQGLDVHTAADVHATIRALAERGQAVIVISSDLDEIVELADRVVVMEHGSLVTSIPGKTPETRDRVARAISGISDGTAADSELVNPEPPERRDLTGGAHS